MSRDRHLVAARLEHRCQRPLRGLPGRWASSTALAEALAAEALAEALAAALMLSGAGAVSCLYLRVGVVGMAVAWTSWRSSLSGQPWSLASMSAAGFLLVVEMPLLQCSP